jgi:prepilin-type N-terminal cleavage/methylation domain-containing protein
MKPARIRGFTLVEAMVVIAIIGVTIVMIPAVLPWLNRQGVGHAVEQLQTDLQLSRVAAIRQGETSTVRFNTPGPNQYVIGSNNRCCDLAAYRGNVHFLKQGPDGQRMTSQVSFNCQGMHTTIVPAKIFLADGDGEKVYRIEIKQAGGISVCRWCNGRWQ